MVFKQGGNVVSDFKIKFSETNQSFTTPFSENLGGEIYTEDKHYTHNQLVPSTTWEVTHNLNKMPSVTTIDSAGTEIKGDITYISVNQLSIQFSSEVTGTAYCN